MSDDSPNRSQIEERYRALLEDEQRAVLRALGYSADTPIDRVPEDKLGALGDAMDGVRVRITEPGLWPKAEEVRYEHRVEMGEQVVAFDVRAISYAEFDRIEQQVPMPQPEENLSEEQQQAMLREQIIALNKRTLIQLDVGWQTLPGQSPDDKWQWYQGEVRMQGIVDSLGGIIQALSGFRNDVWYTGADSPEPSAEPVRLATPDDLVALTKQQRHYRIHRAGTTYEWPLTLLSGQEAYRIEQAHPNPPVPQVPAYASGDTRGKPTGWKADPNDRHYQQQLSLVEKQRMVQVFDVALPFQIPGENEAAKAAWLCSRPAGDVVSLNNFLRIESQDLRSRTDFI